MEKSEVNVGKFVNRHLSQLKLLTRLVEHEVDGAKGGKDITLDRDLVENMLDTLEIFVEDCDGVTAKGPRRRDGSSSDKPAVSRLN